MKRLIIVCACLGAAELVAGETGRITGSVDKPRLVTAVTAVDRVSSARFAGKMDAGSGEFEVDNLPLGTQYDVVVDYAGARLEGVNFRVPRSDYEEEQPLSEGDIETIKGKALSMNKFEDVVEILAISGNVQHAAVLLNKLRTKPFYASKPGEVIWRVELWHFERPEETWAKVQQEMFVVLYRERIQKETYDAKAIVFEPELGGIALTKERGNVNVGRIVLPDVKTGVRMTVGKVGQGG